MTLALLTINVNGMRDNMKSDLVFNWLVGKKFNLICLQETHCVNNDIDRWNSEWKNQRGGDSNWNCGSNESRGVAILHSNFFSNNLHFLIILVEL